MRIGIIGRTRWLFDSVVQLAAMGHEIAFIVTAKAAPEYSVNERDFELLAARLGAKFLQTPKVNDAAVIDWMRKEGEVDIAVSINFSGIIGPEVIGLFRLGVLNAHAGDLPRYRGNACQAWAILQGEARIGLCIHRMVPDELDSGDIVGREYLPMAEDTRIGQVYDWMDLRIPPLMVEAVVRLAKEPDWVLERQSKVLADSLRCYPRRPEDGKIRWYARAVEAVRLVNASSEPYAGAYCSFKEKPLTVWRARRGELAGPYLAVPGQVLNISKTHGWVEVACGDGPLRIEEVEFEGERGTPAAIISSIRERLG